MRTIACASSNRNSASALVSSVLPTPVGPRNRKRAERPVRVLQARRARGARRSTRPRPHRPGRSRACRSSASIVEQFLALALHHPVDRDAGPARDDARRYPRRSLPRAASRCSVAACGLGELLFELRGCGRSDSSPALARSPARCACSSSSRAASSCSLILASPAILSFSACQRVVSSADCCSRLASSLSQRRRAGPSTPRRFSFFSASRSILSWMIRRSSVSISSGLDLDLHADAARRPRPSGRSPCRAGSGR